VSPTWRWSRLSIFGRTLILMIGTLGFIGLSFITLLAVLIPKPDHSVSLHEIARQLRAPSDDLMGGPPPADRPDGPPPPRPDGPRPFDSPSPPPFAMVVTASLAPPTPPAKPRMIADDALRIELAQMLGVDVSKVLVFIPPDGLQSQPDSSGGARLADGFLIAREMPDHSWRIAQRWVEGFPDRFQRPFIGFLVFCLAVLLPLSWAFSRTLSAPIRRFSDAAGRLGRDPNAPLLPREGPAEILAAVDSFNTMQGRINRLIEERTHMVGAIAHDLRTPLTRLAFRLDDLPEPLNSKVAADIDEMKLMISAALDFLRDRSTGGPHERLDFRLLVERVVNDQADLGHQAQLEPGPSVIVEGSPLGLRSMVVNLVENALKYGERARVRLRVAEQRCVLEIDDDGPGIPEKLQQQVFEPFFRIEGSRNRHTGGTGLGLAAVRVIVTEHGGNVSIANRMGGGLRATVTLKSLTS
jgi:two-component system OmpR family sensor kinase